MRIDPFFDPETFTLTYVVSEGTDAVIIDPVLDYDPIRSATSTRSAEIVMAFVERKKLRVHWVLETHAHADHVTASRWVAEKTQARLAIGEGITTVQSTFKRIYDLESLVTDGSQFDRLLGDGDLLSCGALSVHAIATPGHTPGCVTYLAGDAAFVGDALFAPDYGCGRCDFPGGDADKLYTSIHDRLYALPPATRIFPCHDYMPNGRALRPETSVLESRTKNLQIQESTPRPAFVKFRRERDKTLLMPKLLWPAVQINVNGGHLPSFLKIPVNVPL
jgi:glyoxylase-like metal-dependent hydrolase (beta-lactamase superfamily II)